MSIPALRGRALPALLLIALLSGCVKLDVDLALAGHTASGSVIVGLDRGAIAAASRSDPQVAVGNLLEDDGFMPPDGHGVTRQPYEDESFVGFRYVFNQVPLETVNQMFHEDGDPELLQITYHADRGVYEVAGLVDLTSAEQADANGAPPLLAEALLQSVSIRISITFPGDILATNGAVSGQTVTWQAQVHEVTEVHAVASVAPAGPARHAAGDESSLVRPTGSTSALVSVSVAAAVLLAAAAGLGGWWLGRRRPTPVLTDAASVSSPAAVPGPRSGPDASPPSESPTTPRA